MNCDSTQKQIMKTFHFLNFWTKHHEYQKIVDENWRDENITGSPFAIVHAKLKKVKSSLSQWSKNTFGNVFQHVATLEDVIKAMEV